MAQVNWKTSEEVAAEALASWRESASVSAFQAFAALEDVGYLAQVEAMMEDPATSKKTRLAFQKAQVFKRNSPTMASIADALELTESQIDGLFESAKEIEA
jgi:hypothetical protein